MFPHLAALLVGLGGLGGQAQAAPPVPAQAVQAPAPRPPAPAFVPATDPKDAIAKAEHAAAVDHIRVLIVWGGKADARTQTFPKLAKLPGLDTPGPAFSNEYRLVQVEVGRADTNLDLAADYGVKLSAESLPVLTVLDEVGKPVVSAPAAEFLRKTDPQALDADAIGVFLTKHHAIAADPNVQLEAALKQAKAQDKLVFVWFSAPW
jgi:hypothetical protein